MRELSRKNIRIITFLIAAFVITIVFLAISTFRAYNFSAALEANYEKELNSFAEYVSDMDDSLAKGLYASSNARAADMCNTLWRDSYEAMSAVGSLPVEELDMNKTYTFFSKTAEYCKSLSAKLAEGGELTDAERNNLIAIAKYVKQLKSTAEKLQSVYVNSDAKITGGTNISLAAAGKFTDGFAGKSLTDFSESLTDSPQLIYDGPYSDGINHKYARALEGQRNYTKLEAREIARNILADAKGELEDQNESKGDIPSYSFSKGSYAAVISKKGGRLVMITSSDTAENPVYSMPKALELAKDYIKKCGYKNMKCDYYEETGGIFTANFHYVENNVNCYTDSVKISVNMESGKISGLDARNYLNNHTQRSFASPKLSADEAKASLNKHLIVKSEKLALIPKNDKEKLCYEFRCSTDSDEASDILVYINTQTGAEEDILMLIKTSRGVLTK